MTPRIGALLILLCTAMSAHAQPTVKFVSQAPSDASHRVIISNDNMQANSAFAVVLQAAEKAKQVNESNQVSHHYGIANLDHAIVISSDADLDTPVALQALGGKIAVAMQAGSESTYIVDLSSLPATIDNAAAYVAEGFMLRGYAFDTYKAEKAQQLNASFIVGDTQSTQSYFDDQRLPVVHGVFLARDMASKPGNKIYPQTFIDQVIAAMNGIDDVKVKVLDKGDLEKYNMGALLGVGRGSLHDPAMLVIEYYGTDKSEAPIALAGKGITFDTGGISLKGNDGMWGMKSDMSGAAAVAGTLHAVAKQKLPINVIGFMPLAENMPASDAIRPGDVLTTMQGTTIEIISTDAEGRLILSDAVRYAQDEYSPSMLLNIATLTGSAGRALSDEYAALITREWDLSVEMMEVGKQSGEHVWPLPLHPNHFKQLKSHIADIKNSGAGSPGASIGAAVIGTFVDESLPWVHLDIAGVDWLSEANDVSPKGAQGWGVRFMSQLVANEAAKGN